MASNASENPNKEKKKKKQGVIYFNLISKLLFFVFNLFFNYVSVVFEDVMYMDGRQGESNADCTEYAELTVMLFASSLCALLVCNNNNKNENKTKMRIKTIITKRHVLVLITIQTMMQLLH